MYKKLVWPLIVVLSISLMTIFIIGFSISLNISSGEKLVEEKKSIAEKIIVNSHKEDQEEAQDISFKEVSNPKILLIGDSIGFGFGDDGNKGIGNRYGELIQNDFDKNPVNNISVAGDEVLDLESIVSNDENKAIIEILEI